MTSEKTNDRKKEEINFEKLYINIVELKQETVKSLSIFSDFFKTYIEKNENSSISSLMESINLMENNKKMIGQNLNTWKISIQNSNKIRAEKIAKINNSIKTYLKISQSLNKNQKKYKENVQMRQSEFKTLKYYIFNMTTKINEIKSDVFNLEEKITQVKTENKSLFSIEFDLINKILQFEKKSAEVTSKKQKISENLQAMKNNFVLISDRLNSLRHIKNNIINTNEKKKICLIRRLYHLKKFNERHSIGTELKLLHTGAVKSNNNNNNNSATKSFNHEQSTIFSEMYMNVKNYYQSLQMKNINLTTINDRKSQSLINEKSKIEQKIAQLLTFLVNNYSDIRIDSNIEGLTYDQLYNRVIYISQQVNNKNKKIEFEKDMLSEDIEEERNKIKMLKKRVGERLCRNRDKKIKRRYIKINDSFSVFISIRSYTNMAQIERKETELEKERLLQHEKEQDRIKAKEKDRVEKERIEKEKMEQEQERVKAKDKARADKERIEQEQERIKAKEKARAEKERIEKERIEQDRIEKERKEKEVERIEKEREKEKERAEKEKVDKIRERFNHIKSDIFVPPEKNAVKKRETNVKKNNKKNESEEKYCLKDFRLDSSFEESTRSNKHGNIESNEILQIISKNIQEVNDFPKQTSFGEKKKRFYENYMI